jgi:hypothetical protein
MRTVRQRTTRHVSLFNRNNYGTVITINCVRLVVLKIMVLWNVMLHILVDGFQYFGRICRLCLQRRITMKMETIAFSKILTPMYQSTSFHIPQICNNDIHLKNGVLWDVKPCGSCKKRRFGET